MEEKDLLKEALKLSKKFQNTNSIADKTIILNSFNNLIKDYLSIK